MIRNRQGSVDVFEHKTVKLGIGCFLYFLLTVICTVPVVNKRQQYFLSQKMRTDGMKKKLVLMHGDDSTKL